MAMSMTNLPNPQNLNYHELQQLANLQALQMQQRQNNQIAPRPSVTTGLDQNGNLFINDGAFTQVYDMNQMTWGVTPNMAYGVPIDPVEREAKRIFDDLRYSVVRGVDSYRLKKFLRGIKSQPA